LVWGLNNAGDHHKEHSVLLESNLQLDKWAVYGRYEWIQKSSHELGIVGYDEIPKETFPISMFSIGVNRQLATFRNTIVQAGGQAGIYSIDKFLQPAYGKNPVSAQVYLRFTPGLMQMRMN